MRIITEISGSLENKIVYEDGGKVGLFVLPSAIYTLAETRKRFYELHSERKPVPEPKKEQDSPAEDAEDDRKSGVQPVQSSPASLQRRKTKGKDQ